jgi:hypothetical protein
MVALLFFLLRLVVLPFRPISQLQNSSAARTLRTGSIEESPNFTTASGGAPTTSMWSLPDKAPWMILLTACFFDVQAPLAVPELNRERTLKYLECCYRHGLSWEDTKQQIEDFLTQRGVPREGVVRQLTLAKPLLQPWLD